MIPVFGNSKSFARAEVEKTKENTIKTLKIIINLFVILQYYNVSATFATCFTSIAT